jgi:hypothetical protein
MIKFNAYLYIIIEGMEAQKKKNERDDEDD